ncbi:MAG: RsmD family RNA methyltransferase [Flavobacteriales bacterium]|nr:RsmD family RNA methyltransferase [Flavobacteriales bacterium]
MDSQSFIQQHKTKSLPEIALLLSKHPELDKEFIINQINGLQKAKIKLPSFYKNNAIVYPVGLSMEQCSSEQTAIYKSKLVAGKSIVDLTGGFGVDAYFFSKQFVETTYVEQNTELYNLVKENFKNLNASIDCYNSSCEDFLKNNTKKFDLAYIDPSRRDETKRVFKLNECTPNVVELLPQLLKTANQILIKTSPLLDIKQSLSDLKNVSKVWVISANNDCKEVLYLVGNFANTNPEIIAVNLTKTNPEIFSLNYIDEENSVVDYSLPLNFLYEPNASVLKAGGFKSLAVQVGLKKIATNTHLYTSTLLVENFPGRTFKVDHLLDYNAKSIKHLGLTKANISTRNFPDSVEQVKKKLKLTDGGNVYLFAMRDANDKPLLIVTSK